MFFITKLQRSWRLFWACWAIFRSQPEMMIYPAIGGVASLGFIALILGPFALDGRMWALFDESGSIKPQAAIISFLLGLGVSIIANFCATALAAASMAKLAGKQISVEDAFEIAASRFGAIVGYSLIAATVGLILRAIEERGGLIGAIFALIASVAWSLASFLVIPILVMEQVGPVDAMQRSTSLLKKTWGEQVAGTFGIGLATGIVSTLVIMVSICLVLAARMVGLWPLQVFFIAAGVVAVLSVMLISRTMSGIYTAAVYAYATQGRLMPGLDNDLIAGAFEPRKRRGLFG